VLLPSVITATIVFVVIMVGAPVIAFVPVVITPVAAVSVSAVITRLIFRGSHEIHGPTAGVVFTAVLTPVMRMLRGNVQVDRRWQGHARHGFDHDWLRRYQRGWCTIADLKGLRSQLPCSLMKALLAKGGDRC
jgi:hypothetical protein